MARDIAIQDPAMLLDNMLIIQKLLQDAGVQVFLHYGTLLGAIREKGFIPHDNDADLGAFISNFDTILTLLPNFFALGFAFNSQRNGRLLQFTRNGEQVDIFFACEVHTIFGKRWSIDERTTIPHHHLKYLISIDFLGHPFLIPSDPTSLMKNLYGRTWNIPLKDIPSRTNWSWRCKKIFQNPSKIFYYFIRFLGTLKRKTTV